MLKKSNFSKFKKLPLQDVKKPRKKFMGDLGKGTYLKRRELSSGRITALNIGSRNGSDLVTISENGHPSPIENKISTNSKIRDQESMEYLKNLQFKQAKDHSTNMSNFSSRRCAQHLQKLKLRPKSQEFSFQNNLTSNKSNESPQHLNEYLNKTSSIRAKPSNFSKYVLDISS